MDYITLAEKIGFNRSDVISIYKKISGGYYITLYYAKSPILYSLDDWPKKYLKKSFLIWYNSSFNSVIDEILSLFISLDVNILHITSSTLTSIPIDEKIVNNDIDNVFSIIHETSQKLNLFYSPQRVDVKIPSSLLNDLAGDIIKKRKEEISSNIYNILAEIASESDFVNKLKEKKNWIRAIDKNNLLKAISLEGYLDNFLEMEKIKIRYLIASRSLIFDRLLLKYGIKNTLEIVRDLRSDDLKNEIENFKDEIDKLMKYF